MYVFVFVHSKDLGIVFVGFGSVAVWVTRGVRSPPPRVSVMMAVRGVALPGDFAGAAFISSRLRVPLNRGWLGWGPLLRLPLAACLSSVADLGVTRGVRDPPPPHGFRL